MTATTLHHRPPAGNARPAGRDGTADLERRCWVEVMTTDIGNPHARRHRAAHRLHARARLHGDVGVLRHPRRAGRHRHHPPRPRPGRHLPRHRRHVRPVHQRAARRQGDRRPARRGAAGHQVRHRAQPGRLAGSASTAARTTSAAPATPRCSGSASTTSTSTTSTASTGRCRSRRPSARWPSWSRRARSATSGSPRRPPTRSAARTPSTRSPPCSRSTRCSPATSRTRSLADDPRARHRPRAVLAARPRPAHRRGHAATTLAAGDSRAPAGSRGSRARPSTPTSPWSTRSRRSPPARGSRRASCPRLGARPGRRRRADPRHQARDVPRGERRRRGVTLSGDDLARSTRPCRATAVVGDRYADMSSVNA